MPLEVFISDADFPVQPVRVFMVESRFAERVGINEEPWPLPDVYGVFANLLLYRLSVLRLVVALAVQTGEDAPFEVSVTYAGEFLMDEAVAEEHREAVWRNVAFYMAPRLLYPYAREAAQNLTSRWRGEPFTLPFVPVPLDFSEEEMIVPPPPPGSDYQPELPLKAAAS